MPVLILRLKDEMNIILWRQRNSKGTDRKQQECYMNYVTFGGHFILVFI